MKGQFLGLVVCAVGPVRQGMQNKAVVVGALGVIGRYIVERLVEEPDWQVVGLSRRKASDGPRYRHITVDLLDAEDTKRKLAEFTDVTHCSTRHSRLLPEVRRISRPIRPQIATCWCSTLSPPSLTPHRISNEFVLVTGTKYYGVHLGPLKTPMREADPRHRDPIITSIRLTGSRLTNEERTGIGWNSVPRYYALASHPARQ